MDKNKRQQKLITAALLCAAFALTFVLEQIIKPADYMYMLLVVLRKSSVYAIVAVSMNLLNGFTGLFSLGQAGFMLLGAYTYSIFSIPLAQRDSVYQYYDYLIGVSFAETLGNAMGGIGTVLGVFAAILLAGIVAAVVAYLIGFPVLRLKSDYLAIATLGFAEIIRAILQWGKFGPITNASNPLKNYVSLNDFQLKAGGATVYFGTTFALLIAALCIGFIVMLVNSSYGRAFKAIREDEIAAESMGINLYRHKQLAFCISSFFAGIGGATLAMFTNVVQATSFRASMTYEILLIVVLGGVGSISGSCIGAALFIFASEWGLRGLDSGRFILINAPLVFRNGFRLVIFSIIIMTVVLFFRKGIMGDKELSYTIGRIRERFGARRRRQDSLND